jgi:hypothetical protein
MIRPAVIASEAKQSIATSKTGLLRRFAPRNDKTDGANLCPTTLTN